MTQAPAIDRRRSGRSSSPLLLGTLGPLLAALGFLSGTSWTALWPLWPLLGPSWPISGPILKLILAQENPKIGLSINTSGSLGDGGMGVSL